MEKRKKMLLVLCLVLTVLAAGCGAKEETLPTYAMDPAETIPTEAPVVVDMGAYEMTYSGELKDVIVMTELEGDAGLEFTVKLSKSEPVIFVMHYNSDQGELVTVLTDKAGERIPVAFEMAAIPDGLEETDESIFYAAQEAVNEIVESLKLK